jgi:proteic killer suppression protein
MALLLWIVIRTFRDKRTAKVFSKESASKLSYEAYRKSLRKLLLLDASEELEDLRVPPGNQLEKLPGDRKGQCSIRIDGQWRLCFRWEEGDAYEVEIVDYH